MRFVFKIFYSLVSDAINMLYYAVVIRMEAGYA